MAARADELRATIAAFQAQLEQFRMDAGRDLYALRRGGVPYSGGPVPDDPAPKSERTQDGPLRDDRFSARQCWHA